MPHAAEMLSASPVSTTPLFFGSEQDLSSSPVPEAPIQWGMDVAWNDQANVRRGTNYIGQKVLSVGRVSFQPSDLVDASGNLSATQRNTLQSRLNNISLSGVKDIILNCDHEVLCNKDNYPKCDTYYANYNGKPTEWYKVIKASIKYCQSKGFNVVAVSPFNEPDYSSWKEGSKTDFKEIARLLAEDRELEGIRISAGNTLNCDQAASWYNAVKPYVTEGNTHQLAGSFDSYAKFWKTVRADGNHATADELHNTMEALVGIHYGVQTGVWWGFDGACRGEFCKASYDGKEIGYAENRTAWTAGAVYKRTDGRIDAFMGGSERQATTSSFELISTDRDVYYEGQGPMRSFEVTIPGGTGYQTGQTNAERMIQIHYGNDVPIEPLVDGQQYIIVNKNSNMGLSYKSGNSGDAVQLSQRDYSGRTSPTYMRWMIREIAPRSGGDFGYFLLRSVRDTTQVVDVKDWSLEPGGTMIGYRGGLGANEQWFTEYAGEGYYYIRSRQSGLYLDVQKESPYRDALVQQSEFTGSNSQRWRFQPINAALEVKAPSAPTGLAAEGRPGSIALSWNKNSETDVVGYQVARGTMQADTIQWDVIARMLEGTSFLDNGCVAGVEYSYQIKAIDRSRNLSAASEILKAKSEAKGLVLHYDFEEDLADMTENQLHAAGSEVKYNFVSKKSGAYSLNLNGSSGYVRLPVSVGSMKEMTIATWSYQFNSSSSWTRIFDFGNGTDQYMFLTPNNGKEMRFVIKNKGEEQVLAATALGSGWHHIAVTIGAEEIVLYVDGKQVALAQDITLRPSDIRSVMNYVGRSQFAADPLYRGYMDDFRIYNYPLSDQDVTSLYQGEEPSAITNLVDKSVNTMIYSLDGIRQSRERQGLQIVVNQKSDGRSQIVKKLIK